MRPLRQDRCAFAVVRPRNLLLAAALLAAACNRPAQVPPADLLATSVSATLTAQPLPQPTSFPTSISEPTGGEVDEPTAERGTAEPAEATASPTAVDPSPSPPPTAIPLDPDDPRSGLNLKHPDYTDDFSVARWYLYADEDAVFALEDGRLRAANNKTDGIVWWTTTALETTSAYAEITTETMACAGKDAHGIGLRVGGENIDRGYTLEISCDGAYRVRKFIAFDEIPAELRGWTNSEFVNSGPEATNRIGFLASGDQLFVFVNDQLVDSEPIEDADYASGIPSLFANASQTANLTVYFDDFRLWFFPP